MGWEWWFAFGAVALAGFCLGIIIGLSWPWK